ncbi:MAG TPA: metal ABC transporter permease [Acidimicrobiales bacterium]|nr:metal ABC transporter permease [Acidimicrobiales bacterium]
MHLLFEPGFLSSGTVHTALLIGAVTAIVSAIVGVFTVIRSQSFAGHAFTDIATTGGSGAFILGLNPLVGFIGGGIIGAGAMDLIGVQRVRSRDLSTGIVLGAATGLSALFLYLDTTQSATTGATQQILFGSIFEVDPSIIPVVVALSIAVLFALGVIHRPLLLSSVSSELASARGIGVRLVGLWYVIALAVSVGLASIAIGSILSTALLIGPAATALRMTRSLGHALVAACALGTVTTWLGILLAYDSYYWDPGSRGLPVSFFIVAIACSLYVASGLSVVQRFGGRVRDRTGLQAGA